MPVITIPLVESISIVFQICFLKLLGQLFHDTFRTLEDTRKVSGDF